MAVVNLRELELVKTMDADHIPARFWREAARDMELFGLTRELERLAKRRYAEAIVVCEKADAARKGEGT